jgi:hypothetical protein
MSNPSPNSAGPRVVCNLGSNPWTRHDRKWFQRRPRRAHRVRKRFRGEIAGSDAADNFPPSLDWIAVRQLEPERRLQTAFALPPSQRAEWLREVNRDETGAHGLFDLAMKHYRDSTAIEWPTIAEMVE